MPNIKVSIFIVFSLLSLSSNLFAGTVAEFIEGAERIASFKGTAAALNKMIMEQNLKPAIKGNALKEAALPFVASDEILSLFGKYGKKANDLVQAVRGRRKSSNHLLADITKFQTEVSEKIAAQKASSDLFKRFKAKAVLPSLETEVAAFCEQMKNEAQFPFKKSARLNLSPAAATVPALLASESKPPATVDGTLGAPHQITTLSFAGHI